MMYAAPSDTYTRMKRTTVTVLANLRKFFLAQLALAPAPQKIPGKATNSVIRPFPLRWV